MSLAATETEGSSALPAARAWLLCCLLFFATALSFLDRQVLSVLAPRLTAEFGMSNSVYARVVFHPVDFREGFVLVGHDGPHHINLADGRPVLRSLMKYHGKPGAGASVEFRIKAGPITMLSIGVTAQGRFKFVLAEGESVRGPIPATGNTNTRGFFKPEVRTFLKRWVAEGPTHHFALGVGHRAQTLRRIGDALGIESVIVSQEKGAC